MVTGYTKCPREARFVLRRANWGPRGGEVEAREWVSLPVAVLGNGLGIVARNDAIARGLVDCCSSWIMSRSSNRSSQKLSMSSFPRPAPSYVAVKTDPNPRELPRSRVEIAEERLKATRHRLVIGSVSCVTPRCASKAFATVKWGGPCGV